MSAPPDFAACRAWIAAHSKSFYMASLLLPRPVRYASWALYTFCRRADDAVDEAGVAAPLSQVAALEQRLGRIYGAGSLADPADRAFALVVREARIPHALPLELLRGMRMDAEDTRYPDLAALLRYCFRVASTVGLMMTAIINRGRAAPAEVLLRAAELGVAMQLTNIARDVGEDGRRGRVYLPEDLLARCGISTAEVLRQIQAGEPPSPALREAVRQLCQVAEQYYRSAERGVALLPRACQASIYAARLIYAGILDVLARRGYDSLTGRAVVSTLGKLGRLLRALGRAAAPRPRGLLTDGTPGPADALLLSWCHCSGCQTAQAAL